MDPPSQPEEQNGIRLGNLIILSLNRIVRGCAGVTVFN
jgi:hypothetical protein